jgi:gamma-glutamylcyclotransferase (GGCT)/AIG2-like uncharacterized protein YtfP
VPARSPIAGDDAGVAVEGGAVAATSGEDTGREWLFTYGILRDPALLARLLGAVPPGGEAAEVRGYARHTSAAGYYYVVPAADAPPVPGVLWHVTAAELALLDAVEDVDPADPGDPSREYRRVRAVAYTASGALPCWLYEGANLTPADATTC